MSKRGGTYYFRMGIPKELRDHYGKREHIKSLSTKNALLAEQKATELTKHYKEEHNQLRTNEKGTTEIKPPPRSTTSLDPIDKHMKLHHHVLEMETFALKGYLDRCEKTHESLQQILQKDDGLSEASLKNFELDHFLSKGTNLFDLCMQVCEDADLSNKRERNATARKTINKLMVYMEQISAKMATALGISSTINPIPHLAQRSIHPPMPQNIPQGRQSAPQLQNSKQIPLLSEALQKYIEAETPKKNTVKARRGGIKMFIDWAGDKPISEYTADEVVDYRNNCLRKLPDRRKDRKKYEGKTLRKAVEISTPEERICSSRINDLLSSIRVVFRFSMKRSEWGIKSNPASGLNEKKDRQSSQRTGRTCYNDDEVKKLFEILPYNEKKPSWYWSVMICLYNSFRISEICQLHASDIIEKDHFYLYLQD